MKNSKTMIDIILFQPEIPQNTGNIGRFMCICELSASSDSPTGFEINDKKIFVEPEWITGNLLELYEHKDWEDFIQSNTRPNTIYLLSTHAEKQLWKLVSKKEMVFCLVMKVAVFPRKSTKYRAIG